MLKLLLPSQHDRHAAALYHPHFVIPSCARSVIASSSCRGHLMTANRIPLPRTFNCLDKNVASESHRLFLSLRKLNRCLEIAVYSTWNRIPILRGGKPVVGNTGFDVEGCACDQSRRVQVKCSNHVLRSIHSIRACSCAQRLYSSGIQSLEKHSAASSFIFEWSRPIVSVFQDGVLHCDYVLNKVFDNEDGILVVPEFQESV